MDNIIKEIRKELKENIDLKTKNGSSRFFKENIKVYGVKTNLLEKLQKNTGLN